MGFLDHGLLLSLEEDAEPDSFDFGFHQADAEPMAPTTVALRDAAQEHFALSARWNIPRARPWYLDWTWTLEWVVWSS